MIAISMNSHIYECVKLVGVAPVDYLGNERKINHSEMLDFTPLLTQ